MNYSGQKTRTSRFLNDIGKNTLIILISALLVVFVMFAMVHIFYLFSYPEGEATPHYLSEIHSNLALPASFSQFLDKPWTLISFMVYHLDVWRLISSLIWLWVFGYLLYDLTGNRMLIPIFIYGSLGGALAFMLSNSIIPASLSAMDNNLGLSGAIPGVMAIAVAVTVIAPGYRLFTFINGGIPLWVITLIFIVIDLATIPRANTGQHVAHLGGAFVGYAFMMFHRRGYDGSDWMNNFYDWFMNLFNPDKPSRKSKPVREELFYKSKSEPYSRKMNLTQHRIDAILDKISQKGYESLNKEEKELLKRASEEDL